MNNENEQAKNVVTSYRVSQDAKDKIQQQLKDLGLTQEQYFNKVVSSMELENVKQNSFLSKDTTIIQSNLDAILNSFISISDSSNNLINNKDAEIEDQKTKYKDMLLNKEISITKQKQELQDVYDNINVLQVENDKNKNELLNIRAEYNKQLEQLDTNLNDKKLIVTEYKQKNDDLLSIVAEYKKYKTEVEEYKKLLSDAQSKNISLNDVIKNNDFAISNLNNDIEKVKLNSQRDIEQLKKENNLNIKLASAEIKEYLNNKLNQEQQKHNAEIEGYQTKYKALLEQMEKERTVHTNTTKKNNTAAPHTK